MNWKKEGLIFKASGKYNWSKTHAQVPFPLLISDSKLRIFFATRNDKSQTSTSFIDVNPDNPKEILYEHNKPVLMKGKSGVFDDSGAMPSWFIYDNNRLYLYYTGWNTSETASYRLSIGLAVSDDNGETFNKVYEGPILDRSIYDHVWVAQPAVLKENGLWRMYYLSCTKIERINDHPEPYYNVKYAESDDGVNWIRNGHTCIDYDEFTDAIGRPWVFKENGIYKMFYSFRNAENYRTDPNKAYRLGYAESDNGINWERQDSKMIISFSEDGWDSKMMDYCSSYFFNGKRFLIYNGNGFGQSGFGFAVLKN